MENVAERQATESGRKARNVYRFRKLKWADPEAKLKMLVDAPSTQEGTAPDPFRFLEPIAIIIIVGSLVIIIASLLT